MKDNNIKVKIPNGCFMAGDVIYPMSQFEEVIAAQATDKPLPVPKKP